MWLVLESVISVLILTSNVFQIWFCLKHFEFHEYSLFFNAKAKQYIKNDKPQPHSEKNKIK